MTDSAGTLGKALDLPARSLLALKLQRRQAASAKAGRNLFSVRYDRSWIPPAAGLDFALCEVLGDPSHVNKTRIPRRRK
jgi:hypothetical protein